MRLTIIVADGAVYKDGVMLNGIDLSFIPSNFHALQWVDTKGTLEFCSDENDNKPPNEVIEVLPDWANLALAKWQEVSDELKRRREEFLANEAAQASSNAE